MLKSKTQGKTNLALLCVVAVVVVVGAFVVYRDETASNSKATYTPEKLFAKLNLDDVQAINIITESDTVDLKRVSDTEWGLASRGGFPVESERVARLGLAIRQMEPSDRMTQNTAKYEDLGVTDTPESGRVQLLDKEGKTLAEVFLGSERKQNPGMGRGDGQFVRVAGDPWVYMIPQQIQLDTLATSWLKKEIVNVEEKDIQRVNVADTVTQASFTLSRTGAEPFQITEPAIPEGQRAKMAQVSATARALANLSLMDVLTAEDPKVKDVAWGNAYTAWLKNGAQYVVETGKIGEDYYAKLTGKYEQPHDLSLGDVRTSDSVQAKDMGSGETKAKEVADAHGKWIYRIQNWTYTNLTKPFSEMLEPIPSATPTLSPTPSPEPSPSPTPSEPTMTDLIGELQKEANPAGASEGVPQAPPQGAPPAEAPPAEAAAPPLAPAVEVADPESVAPLP